MDQLNKILSASLELFTQYGFKSITMDDIARRAGISKKTLYQHFANKQEVVNESVMWYQCRVSKDCECVLEQAKNPIEAMVRILAFFDNVYKQVNPMALHELQRFFPEAYTKFREQIVSRDVMLIKDNITQGMALGLYREGLNAELMARFRLETSLLALQPTLMVNTRADLMSVALEIGEHFMYGIMTPKGEKQYQQYKAKYLKQSTHI